MLEKLTEAMDGFIENLGIPFYDCVVMKDGKCVYRHSNGCTDTDQKTPVTGKELYDIYSCSKLITCTAALQLYERGKFGLDDYLYLYMPEFENMTVKDENGNVRPAQNKITVRELFTMTAGFGYDVGSPMMRKCVEDTDGECQTLTVMEYLAKEPLLFEPGYRWNYSLCHDVVAAVIEVASGRSYGEYLRESVFEPLGIHTLTLHPTEAEKAALAARYRWDARENPIQEDNRGNPYCLSDRYESGGAGLFGNVDGYILLADALACGGVGRSGNRILQPESIDRLRENQQHGAARRDFDSFRRIGYGYGLGVRTLVDNRYSESPIGEFGWDGAAGAYVLIDPQNGLSAFFAAHVLGMGRAYTEFHPRIRDLIYAGLNTKGGQL